MRTFRFRAFDKEEKVMIYGIENIYDGGYFVNSNNQEISIYSTSLSSSSFGNNLNNEDIEIMQFTGLFDKNGTPIYEGDIVKCKFAFGDNVCEVVEEKGCYWVSQKNKEIKDKAHDNLYWHIDGIEVLGNIYEHPHLLESEEK